MFVAGQKVRIIQKNCSNSICMGIKGGCTGLIGKIRDSYGIQYSIGKQVPVMCSDEKRDWCVFEIHQVAPLGIPEEEME